MSLYFPLIMSYLTSLSNNSFILLRFCFSYPSSIFVRRYTLYLFLMALKNSSISVLKVYSDGFSPFSMRRCLAEMLMALRLESVIFTYFDPDEELAARFSPSAY